MNIINYAQRYDAPISLALGYFDSLHLGHRMLIEEARVDDTLLAVFTFTDDFYSNLSSSQPLVLTIEEREAMLESMGVDVVLEATPNSEFLSTSPIDFLNTLILNLDVRRITVGLDYTYGVGGSGDVDSLREFCDAHGIEFLAVDLMNVRGTKIGTRYIRRLLLDGDVTSANDALGYRYFILGTVVEGMRVGREIGYPTANIIVQGDKVIPLDGVYATIVTVRGVRYMGMTSIGTRPTFDGDRMSIETHILDYSDSIYGEDIRLEFVSRIRDNHTYPSIDELVARLRMDEDIVRGIL